ncbi:RagB/SusD family nutrient uptake outer membrane protein [Persicobacter diffluens]|uniref:Membrane protein n=1 Tax=Persicobacter diffluens TaxID=981 RepID=A0AAN5AL93_9BACT|nr:membrane protein [Persicobacter diffluens]
MKKIIFYISVVAFCLQGCFGELDQKPWGVALEDEFYKTEEDAVLAINAAYSPMSWMQDAFNSNMAALDCSSDDTFKGGGHAGDQTGLTEFAQFRITSSNSILADRWKDAYQGIFRANKVIENVPGIDMDENLRNRIVGEAYFLRGYYYFELLVQFGGVIKVDRVLRPDEFNQSRSSRAEIIQLIEDDLTMAVDRLPKKSEYSASTELGRATKGAALAYLMKLNVMEKNWSAASKYAENIFALGEYELVADYGLIFQQAGEHCSESIFEVNYNENSIKGWGRGNPGSWTGVCFMPRAIRGTGFCQVDEGLVAAYEEGDPRKELTVYHHENTDYGTDLYFRKYSCAPYSDYPWPSNGPSHGANNTRLVRLADIYLMYAEAQYHLGNEGLAQEYVNMIRERARGGDDSLLPDVTATGEALLNAIYFERRIELAGEGLRFWDLVRTGRAATVLKDRGFVAGTHELRPIPNKDVILSNGAIEQNPGY